MKPKMTFFYIIETFPFVFLHADKGKDLPCLLNVTIDIRITVYDDIDVRT